MALADYPERLDKPNQIIDVQDVLGVARGPTQTDQLVNNESSGIPLTLQRNSVLTHRGYGLVWDDGLPIFQDGRDADLFPLNGYLHQGYNRVKGLPCGSR